MAVDDEGNGRDSFALIRSSDDGRAAHIRRYRPGDEAALFEVHYSAIHLVASRDYSAEQIAAWAPLDIDPVVWTERIQRINPYVVDCDGVLVAYADLQRSGYIDQFFVSGKHPGRGFGALLMNHLLSEARQWGLSELTADVSRTAQGFFERFGFRVVEQRFPTRRGIVLPNALMRLELMDR
jgi:putative acetyltransferase